MSIRLNGAYPTRNNAGLAGRTYPGGFVPVTEPWVRNPSWPACEANAGDNKIVGLYAVWPGDGVGNGGNFFAVTISGAYTINYGDGTTTNYSSSGTAYYEFDYNDADLAGTDAPVTLTASTDTVNRTAHGYTNGMQVRFYNIVTTTGLSENTPYFVINATANTFQVSATAGGSAIDLVGDGSATLLPYKIATVTITPQAGNNLTSVNFYVKHNQTGLVNGYSTGWLDIAIAAPSCTILNIGSSGSSIRHLYLERVRLNQLGNITSFNGLFQNLSALRDVVIAGTITSVTLINDMFNSCVSITSVPLFYTSSVTSMARMFSSCRSLTSVPLFDTGSVNNMSSMFTRCDSLTSVPLFDTSNVTNMTSMFQYCYSLTSVPFFDTSSVNNMNNSFGSCYSLTSIPLFDTSNVTNMTGMFAYCYSLTSVPLFDTSTATGVSSMLQDCYSLTSVPLFDTSSVTQMSSMLRNCYSLTSVPLFDTSSVNNISFMFANSYSVISVPLFNTSSVTNMRDMFNGCISLTSVPSLTTTAVSSSSGFTNVFANCNSLSRIEASDFRFTFSVANCKLSSAALDEIYTNLPTVVGQTITVTGNYGTTGDDPTIATAKGWTVTG